jgi:mono/diheme cytochrome c family protein
MNLATANRRVRASARRCALSAYLTLAFAGAGLADDGAHFIALPKETAELRPSELTGYRIALQKCGVCHSADYVNLQPPRMTLAQWTSEMVKMQRAYGAPIDDEDIKLLAIYLASVYGDATSVPPPEASAPASNAPGTSRTP